MQIFNANLIKRSCVLLFCLPYLLSACSLLVPAKTPPQLEHTPGVPIIITDDYIDAGWFTIDYPDGWRVVKTSISGQPLALVFASPDDEMTMSIQTDNCDIPENTPEPDTETLNECIRSDARFIHISGSPTLEQIDIYTAIFERVVESVEFP